MESESYAFGSFQLIPGQRLLLDNGRTLPLGGRALDILTVLVEAAGETVSNLQIMARAWPTTLVEEGSLRVHVAALRKALGDGRAGVAIIANNPGRGYAFVAPVRREQAPPPASLPRTGRRTAAICRLRSTRIVGRDGDDRAIGDTAGPAASADHCRVQAGSAKPLWRSPSPTRLRASYTDGVWFVGLASLPHPTWCRAPSAPCLASAIGRQPVAGIDCLVARQGRR